MPVKGIRLSYVSIALMLVLLVSTGCSDGGTGEKMMLFPEDQLPQEVQSAPQVVKEAYQYAVANPDITQHLPCYCGCGSMGHTSNYSCYVSAVDQAGNPTFDNHALGCSICVDITQDAIRMTGDGSDVEEIRAYVDQAYSKYGPTNMP